MERAPDPTTLSRSLITTTDVPAPRVEWFPKQPNDAGLKLRAAFEAIAYLIALAVVAAASAGIFRGTDPRVVRRHLTQARFLGSQATRNRCCTIGWHKCRY